MKSFAVIGLGRFGRAVATTLYQLGHEVLAIDKSEEAVQSIANDVTHAVSADVVDESVLRALGVQNFSVGIVAIGEDMQSSILATLMLRDLGLDQIIAKATSELHAKVLTKVGADKVIFPEYDTGVRLAHHLAVSNILDYIELSSDYSIMEVRVPKPWIGKTPAQLEVRSRWGVNIIAIKRGESTFFHIDPNDQATFQPGDILILAGTNELMDELKKIK